MGLNAYYRLNRHHKFKQNDRKYVADLETNDIVEVNEVEWDILQRYGTQTQYQIVEALKEKYKRHYNDLIKMCMIGPRSEV